MRFEPIFGNVHMDLEMGQWIKISFVLLSSTLGTRTNATLLILANFKDFGQLRIECR